MVTISVALLLFSGSEGILAIPGDYTSVPARPAARAGLWTIDTVTETVLSSSKEGAAERYVIRKRAQYCRGEGAPPGVGWLRSPDGQSYVRARTPVTPHSSVQASTEVFSGDFDREYTHLTTTVQTKPATRPSTPISSTSFASYTWVGECPSGMAIDDSRELPMGSDSR